MKRDLKFILSFFVISCILYILISIFYDKNFPIIGIKNVASNINNILNFLGIKTLIIDGDTIFLPSSVYLKIIFECSGAYEMMMLSSIILSYPASLKNKLYGIVSGITIIYILNMIRLISISWILVYYTDKFDFVDRYLWQISLVIFISATYTMWLKLIERSGSSSQ